MALTEMWDEKTADRVKKTPFGMAHWAGTGPEGAVCAGCHEWKGYRPKTSKAMQPAGSCKKFIRMTHREFGVRFPGYVPACSYYTDFIPELEDENV